MSQNILILATDGFEQSELEKPKALLEQAGYETTVASPKTGKIRGWDQKDWGRAVTVDMALADADEANFDALLLPGGQMNPDVLRMDDEAIDLISAFYDAGKPVAAICHAPWLLVEADVVDGHRVTAWPSVRTDLANAGGEVVDAEVVVDQNLITSRKPDDIPAFTDALIAMLKERAGEEV